MVVIVIRKIYNDNIELESIVILLENYNEIVKKMDESRKVIFGTGEEGI